MNIWGCEKHIKMTKELIKKFTMQKKFKKVEKCKKKIARLKLRIEKIREEREKSGKRKTRR
jgi:hypothetical protein